MNTNAPPQKSSPRSPGRWRGVPAEERCDLRRRMLLDACFELVGTTGVAGTTVRGVCEAADLNPRYFYESFSDLDALLVAVFDHVAGTAVAVTIEAAEAVMTRAGTTKPDPLTMARATIGAYMGHVTADPRRSRVIFVEGLSNEALTRRRVEAMRGLEMLVEHKAVEQSGHVDSAVKIAATLVVGGLAELLIAWLNGRLDVTFDEMVEDAAVLSVATGQAAADLATQRERSKARRDSSDPRAD